MDSLRTTYLRQASELRTKVFVVIITFNGEEDAPALLKTYREYTSPEVALVIVDNASSDTTVEIAQRECPNAIIIQNTQNHGYAGGARQGMEYARAQGARYIAVLNQDMRLTARWLEPLIAILDTESQCAAVQPRIMLYPDTDQINSYGNTIHFLGFGYTLGYQKTEKQYSCQEKKEIASCSGAAVVFRASALEEVGYIDNKFFLYYEDSDLSWRLRLQGYQLFLCCQSTVYHRYEFSRSIQKFYYMERNRLVMMLKNYSFKTLFLIAPMFWIMEAGMVGLSLLGTILGKRDSLTLREKMRSYFFFFKLSTWRYLAQERKKIQKTRKVSDKSITKLFCDSIDFQDIDNPVLRRIVNPITHWYWTWIQKIL